MEDKSQSAVKKKAKEKNKQKSKTDHQLHETAFCTEAWQKTKRARATFYSPTHCVRVFSFSPADICAKFSFALSHISFLSLCFTKLSLQQTCSAVSFVVAAVMVFKPIKGLIANSFPWLKKKEFRICTLSLLLLCYHRKCIKIVHWNDVKNNRETSLCH